MSSSEAGLEPQLGLLAGKVREAEAALMETLLNDLDHDWSPRELQRKATNSWSAAVVSIAFWQLVNSGRLKVDEDLRVHPVGATS